MKTYAYTLLLKDSPEIIEKYKEYHKNVWPEVLESLTSIGIESFKIFLLGRRMFMILNAVDTFQPEDMQHYAKSKRVKQWDGMMSEFQEKVEEARSDEWWAMMEEVFNLEEQLGKQ